MNKIVDSYITPRKIELLAPAKNLEYGIAAIDHGADAIYIGAERFGARSSAGNSVEDIHCLCEYAHKFMAKVYVTVNTIVYDSEINDTVKLIWKLYEAGVDAILIQDMGLLKAELPPIEIHASTQTDNRTAEKVKWFESQGVSRVVLARELSLGEIESIHKKNPDMELETFVHGALCVCFSGICYASQFCFKRSANRGECAQFCRLKFDLEDADGNILERNRYLLSLKDMCRYDNIEELLNCGVTSLKIEGRLKDITYVKNVTAAYSKKINEIISKEPDKYCRASLGKCEYSFIPDLSKTFNRGYTDYFLKNEKDNITSFDTPKSKGEFVGFVKEIRTNSFNVSGTTVFSNGDGLCFFNEKNELTGFRINRVDSNRLFPQVMPKDLHAGIKLYRNNDIAFEKLLSHQSSKRKIPVIICVDENENGISLTASIKNVVSVMINKQVEKQIAIKPQTENIIKQLTKLGNTSFECTNISVSEKCSSLFFPSSFLAQLRREFTELLCDKLNEKVIDKKKNRQIHSEEKHEWYPKSFHYLYNMSNQLAKQFYMEQGFDINTVAFEQKTPENPLIMQCKHCIRYSLKHCLKKEKDAHEWKSPLYLRLSDGRRFKLQFNCKECQMNIYGETNKSN